MNRTMHSNTNSESDSYCMIFSYAGLHFNTSFAFERLDGFEMFDAMFISKQKRSVSIDIYSSITLLLYINYYAQPPYFRPNSGNHYSDLL